MEEITKLEKHYNLLKAAELLGVTTQTLRNWDNAGKIRTIRTPGNQRRIPESEILRLSGSEAVDTTEIEHKPQRTMAEKSNKNNCLLMCKDTIVYDVTENKILNKNLLPGCMLKGIMNYSQWMKTRSSMETNFSSERLKRSGFEAIGHEDIILKTRAISLSDCYWIKKQSEDILFEHVTPYIQFTPLSNLFISGKTDKRWIDTHTLLKINSFREFEPYILCAALGLDNTAEAQVSEEGMIIGNFTSLDYFYESMEQSGVTQEPDEARNLAIETFKENAVALFVIDYLIENNDRFADDFGCLRSTETGECVSMAPLYNFDWAWSGEVIPLPAKAWDKYRDYINNLCRWAINVAGDFENGTIIERRAGELMRV